MHRLVDYIVSQVLSHYSYIGLWPIVIYGALYIGAAYIGSTNEWDRRSPLTWPAPRTMHSAVALSYIMLIQ